MSEVNFQLLPACWYDKHGGITHDPFEGVIPLYTAPVAHQPLTEARILQEAEKLGWHIKQTDIACDAVELTRAIEAAHGIGNL